jgi:ribulose-5-phosphate 4-epimerase/fuculose-1-phosphate aldolase
LILVNEAGKPLTPTKGHKLNKAGFMIHSVLHKRRPDVNAAVHTHSRYGRAWSVFGRPVEMLNQDCCYFYNDLSVYEGFGGVVQGQEEGENIARALGPVKKNVILQNHGYVSRLKCGHVEAYVRLANLLHTQYLELRWHRRRSDGVLLSLGASL